MSNGSDLEPSWHICSCKDCPCKLQSFERENLIFIDTEFSDLDPYKGEVLSVGIVTLDGRELYLELEHKGPVAPWVKQRILPLLNQPKQTRSAATRQIKEFLADSNPYAVAFVDNYDTIYLTKLFGHGNLPFRWMTIDFSTVLFMYGVNPVRFMADDTGAMKFYRDLGVDLKKYRQHHALDDARLLCDVWQILFSG